MSQTGKRWGWWVTAGAVLVLAGPVHAQGGFPPSTFANLQVLPAATPPGEVIATMKAFTQALGVRCQFCHVGREGMPLDQFDFVSDDNAHKRTARTMMRMVQRVNADLGAALPAGAEARVTCYTCHRGAQHPVAAPDAVKPPQD